MCSSDLGPTYSSLCKPVGLLSIEEVMLDRQVVWLRCANWGATFFDCNVYSDLSTARMEGSMDFKSVARVLYL